MLKARLQYAQLKITTGMSTENLQQIEHAFLASPRQPRIPLPEEYPPTPAHSSPHSRKLKRMLLSAMTPAQNSWRKKKKIREKKKNEAIEDEAAARTILMLSSSSKTAPALTPPSSVHKNDSHSSPEDRVRYYPLPVYKEHTSIYDAVSNIPNYNKKSKIIGKSLPRRVGSPPPAVISRKNQGTGSPHQYYQYNRPLPPPPKYYKPKPPPMYGRPLSEDPFYSTPIIQNNISASRNRTPPSPPLSKK